MSIKKPLTSTLLGLTILGILLLLTACLGTPAARYNNAGNEDFESQDYEAAVDDYIAAQRENPDLAEPYYNAGNAFHRDGNLESAVMQSKQAAREAEGELAQNSYYNLGNSYFKAEDWPNAIDAYKQALRLNPDDEQAKYNLELALKNLQQQQQQQGGGEGEGNQQQQQGGSGQQQGQGQGQEDQQNQGGQGEQEDQDQPNGGGGQEEQDEQGQSGSQGQNQGSSGSRGLTPQEAEQLLDALGQDSQTLQERLQQGFFAPGRPPGEDW